MGDSRNQYLIKNTIIFTLGNLGSKLITFFLIPLYTNALTTSEYGVIDLIASIGMVAGPILTLNICESVMRFSLDKGTNKKQITQIGTGILLVGMVAGLIILPICHSFDRISQYAVLVYFNVFSSAVCQLYLCDLRGKELLTFYSVGNVLHTFLIAVLNVFFLLVLNASIEGYLIAYIISNMLTAIYAIIVGEGYRSFSLLHVNWNQLKRMVKYSVVLIPNSFMWWIMNSSDRIMVSGMVGIEANGIYAISYKLPTLISTMTQVFNQAWSYSAIREEGAVDEEEYNNKILKLMIGGVMLVGICMMAIVKPFLKIYVSSDYYAAWRYTPFLIIGCVYLTLASFMSTSYTVHKDSFGFLFSGMFGAMMNIVLNLLLIPKFEVYGAALATCVSYIAVFVFRLFHTRKYLKYNVMTKEFVLGTIILIISAVMMFVDCIVFQIIQISLVAFSLLVFKDVWLPYAKMIIRRFYNTNK